MRDIRRELLLGVEDALLIGAKRAYQAAIGMDQGHLPHVLGQMRHFHMNEAFHRALTVAGAAPPPLKGNSVINGRTGMFRVARFNVPEGIWVNGRRSQIRKQMAEANRALEPLVQPLLFDVEQSPSDGVVFFVCGFREFGVHSEKPASIHIAVPDSTMRDWLFKETLGTFLARLDGAEGHRQEDLATPKLKKRTDRKDSDGTQ